LLWWTYEKNKKKEDKGGVFFEIYDPSTPSEKTVLSIYISRFHSAYRANGNFYVDGVWISKLEMRKMAKAMLDAVEFVG
jgi:hypothetical protein